MLYSLVSFPAFEVSFFVSSVLVRFLLQISTFFIFVRGFPFLKMTILGEYFVSLFGTA